MKTNMLIVAAMVTVCFGVPPGDLALGDPAQEVRAAGPTTKPASTQYVDQRIIRLSALCRPMVVDDQRGRFAQGTITWRDLAVRDDTFVFRVRTERLTSDRWIQGHGGPIRERLELAEIGWYLGLANTYGIEVRKGRPSELGNMSARATAFGGETEFWCVIISAAQPRSRFEGIARVVEVGWMQDGDVSLILWRDRRGDERVDRVPGDVRRIKSNDELLAAAEDLPSLPPGRSVQFFFQKEADAREAAAILGELLKGGSTAAEGGTGDR